VTYFGSQPLIQITEDVTQALRRITWLDGLQPERSYQRDFELADLESKVLVFPAATTFVRDSRRSVSPQLVVGMVAAKRLPLGDVSLVDKWASEFLRMRDTMVETYIEGFDVYEWNHPSGEVFEVEYQRKGVLALVVEVTYQERF
jgi:hypothetical protein